MSRCAIWNAFGGSRFFTPGTRFANPTLTWFHKDAELVIAKKRKHSMEMAALEEVEELLEETIIG